MFSVVIPLFNKELSVLNTINSVLNQTFKEFEVIVVNDGSTDSSLAIVENIKDSRVRIINQKNQGVSAARNLGIHNTKFQWITLLDGDDLWKENHLEVLKKLIDAYTEDKVFCTSFLKSDQEIIKYSSNTVRIIEDYFKEALKFQFFWTSVTCIHISVFEKVDLFNIRLKRGEDLELWARIGRKYRIIKSDAITAIYKIDAENRSDKFEFNLNHSFLSLISLRKEMDDSEYAYFRQILIRNIKRFIVKKDFKMVFYLLRKLLIH